MVFYALLKFNFALAMKLFYHTSLCIWMHLCTHFTHKHAYCVANIKRFAIYLLYIIAVCGDTFNTHPFPPNFQIAALVIVCMYVHGYACIRIYTYIQTCTSTICPS